MRRISLLVTLCGAAALISQIGIAKPLPLAITCPPSITDTAVTLDGKIETYPPASIIGGKSPIRVTYNPASGSLFPVGATSVRVTATDHTGVVRWCVFTITVEAPLTPVPVPPDPTPTPVPDPTPTPTPAPAPAPGAYTSTKAVLTGADFSLVGVLRPPDICSSQPKGMTAWVVNGEYRLLCWSSYDDHVYEWTPGVPSMAQGYYDLPFAPVTRDLGVPYGAWGGFAFQANNPPSLDTTSDMSRMGIHWYAPTGQLIFLSTSYYNNDTKHSTVNIGTATFNGTSFTPQGMWYTDEPFSLGGFGSRFSTGMVTFPDDFAQNAVGGRPLGIGFGGGYWQGILGNSIAMGPTLLAMNPIVPSAQPYQAKLAQPLLPLLFHPYHRDDVVIGQSATALPRIGRRPRVAPAINKYGNPTNPLPDDPWLPDADGTSYYSQSDQNAGGVWIEGPNKHGFLVFPTIAVGSAQTIVRNVAFVTETNGVRFYDLTVDSTTGFDPNMYLHLEDPTATHYGGWLVAVAHNLNHGPYAANLPEGNTFNPVINGTTIRVYDVEGTAGWNPVNAIGRRLTAGEWYGGAGPKSASQRTYGLVYDPVDLAAQVGKAMWSELDAKASFALPYDRRRESFVSNAAVPGVTAATYNGASHLVYLNVMGADLGPSYNQNLPLVYVYRVND